LRPGDIFLDVGANVGYYSLLASGLVGPGGKVIAIEASPSIALELQANVSLNELANVDVVRAAVADRNRIVDVYLANSLNRGRTTIVPSVAKDGGQVHESSIQAFPLTKLVDIDLLRRARLVKIDVEGAEADVLEGIRDVLPELQEPEWLVELTPEANRSGVEKAIELFQQSGYRLYQVENSSSLGDAPVILEELTDVPDSQTDVLATKRETERVLRL
jgi:FkbM family methyltransferase